MSHKRPFDIDAIRADFPALAQKVNGKPLVYLDSAASSQTPRQVVAAIDAAYNCDRANIHRAVHTLSQRATKSYEAARGQIAQFLNAPDEREVLYVRGATEGINLVAQTWGRQNVHEGDVILVTEMEHHANIVPWQLLAKERGATVLPIPFHDDGTLDLAAYTALLTKKPKLVGISHASNALGTVNPVKAMTAEAHAAGAVVLIDGCQAVPHMRVDVQDIGADFYAFSGHKMLGPTGIGGLWGRLELLDSMPPWQGGGDMIERVSFEETTFAPVPAKFEAGTPHITGAIGLGAAAQYMMDLDWDAAEAHEQSLLAHATELLSGIDKLHILGNAPDKVGVISFIVDGVHPTDVGTLLDFEGVAVRTGHHCAQTVMARYGVPATARASFAFYNTHAEVEHFAKALREILPMLL